MRVGVLECAIAKLALANVHLRDAVVEWDVQVAVVSSMREVGRVQRLLRAASAQSIGTTTHVSVEQMVEWRVPDDDQ